jgi:hypothetical protein
MKQKLKVIGTCTLLLAFLLLPMQYSYSADFIPLTVVSSQKWNGVVGDRNSLGKTIIMARNDSSFTLENVQAMVSYFDGSGKLIKTSNTYGAMLNRVAPGETIGIFSIFTDQPSTYSVELVAGIPTSTPANRNIRIDSASWSTPDAQGYKFLKVQVTNLNKTVAEGVQFMANCGNFGGPYVFGGPTFRSSLEAGGTTTLYQIYGPQDPPCNNVPTLVGDATSAPSIEAFPSNYSNPAADKAAADKAAADKAAADAATAAKAAADKAAADKVAAALNACSSAPNPPRLQFLSVSEGMRVTVSAGTDPRIGDWFVYSTTFSNPENSTWEPWSDWTTIYPHKAIVLIFSSTSTRDRVAISAQSFNACGKSESVREALDNRGIEILSTQNIETRSELSEASSSAALADRNLTRIEDEITLATREADGMINQLSESVSQIINTLQKMIKDLSAIVMRLAKN